MKYKKKPVEIDAIRFYDDSNTQTELSVLGLDPVRVNYADKDNPRLVIDTLEGTMFASVGDYIIRGVKGEFYPCKPDVFELTYEATSE
ncbi:hypothetical protein [Anaerotruncus rubiinfantis]|uniref:hypothetical protein n=1 Tax=Anaerotruncus rubiinfantis TaxID=1720200 RepID=UPI0008335F56|nr:hypothetical protein [Anaerotruncus rubiinfantis]